MLRPIHLDLTGNLQGWYAFAQDGYRFPGDQLAAALDEEHPLDLVFVPNRVRTAVFWIESTDPPIRFQAPVGLAIPVRTLLDHLVRWLDLPTGDWTMWVDESKLDPLQILEDVATDKTLTVVVRQ